MNTQIQALRAQKTGYSRYWSLVDPPVELLYAIERDDHPTRPVWSDAMQAAVKTCAFATPQIMPGLATPVRESLAMRAKDEREAAPNDLPTAPLRIIVEGPDEDNTIVIFCSDERQAHWMDTLIRTHAPHVVMPDTTQYDA